MPIVPREQFERDEVANPRNWDSEARDDLYRLRSSDDLRFDPRRGKEQIDHHAPR